MSVAIDPRKSGKRLIRWLLGERTIGMLNYVRFPDRRIAWGGAFNGQPMRCKLFADLIERTAPSAIVETGTYLGTTTEFMAETGLPVFTIEGDSRNYGYARARLWRRRNVKVFHGDSRAVLGKLFDKQRGQVANSPWFFYLDAHWNEDLPLAEELEIIFTRCPAAVVMIDDFQVPFDSGYVYDDYGAGKALCSAYIAPIVSAHRLRVFYPSTTSLEEGGQRRGCVVLTKQHAHAEVLSSISLLRVA